MRREVGKRVLRSTFTRGPGAPLAFLWAAGSGLFLITWSLPAYAALWTLANLGFAGLTARDALRSNKAWAAASREFLDERFTTDRISASRHRDAIRKGVDVFHEVLIKV